MLDIGAGSGLLSMMAARAGAAHVTAIERVKSLAKCAAEIATTNGYAEAVAIVHGESTDMEPEDLEGERRADLLVSEVRTRCATKAAKGIPQRNVTILAAAKKQRPTGCKMHQQLIMYSHPSRSYR